MSDDTKEISMRIGKGILGNCDPNQWQWESSSKVGYAWGSHNSYDKCYREFMDYMNRDYIQKLY